MPPPTQPLYPHLLETNPSKRGSTCSVHWTSKKRQKKAAGNWQDFSCFVWLRERELEDADQWAVIYTHHRDSGLLDQSNAAVIAKALGTFHRGR